MGIMKILDRKITPSSRLEIRVKILTLVFVLVSTLGYAQSDNAAKIEYENAEEAFANKNYSLALEKITLTEQLLKKSNPKTQYLQIQILNNLANQNEKDKKFQNALRVLDELGNLVSKYLLLDIADQQKYRDVYDIKASIPKRQNDIKERGIFINNLKDRMLTYEEKFKRYDTEPFDKLMNGIDFSFESWKNAVLTNELFKKNQKKLLFSDWKNRDKKRSTMLEKTDLMEYYKERQSYSYSYVGLQADNNSHPTYKYKGILFKAKEYKKYLDTYSAMKLPIEGLEKEEIELVYRSFGFDPKGEMMSIAFDIKTPKNSGQRFDFIQKFMKRPPDDKFNYEGENYNKMKERTEHWYWAFKGKVLMLTVISAKYSDNKYYITDSYITLLKHNLKEAIQFELNKEGKMVYDVSGTKLEIDPKELNLD